MYFIIEKFIYVSGDWGLGPIPNPQSPIPNPQSPFILINKSKFIIINYFLNN